MKPVKNKYILLFIVALIPLSLLFSKYVDRNTAHKIAKNWYEYKSNLRVGVKNFDNIKENQYNNHSTYYIFSYNEGGFVIVSANDVVIPILGYSVDSKFDENDIPIQLQEWLLSYDQQIDDAIQRDLENAKILPLWDEIASFDSTIETFSFDSNQDMAVAPLITTTWSPKVHTIIHHVLLMQVDPMGMSLWVVLQPQWGK